jgi:hypothetical protein
VSLRRRRPDAASLSEADLNRKRFETEIAAVLKADQKKKWPQRCEEMQKRMPPPPSESH